VTSSPHQPGAVAAQVIEVMIRQLGHLFLQPMLDAMWRQLAAPDAPGTDKPVFEVRMPAPGPPPGDQRRGHAAHSRAGSTMTRTTRSAMSHIGM
jgi:hypothetical protein